MKTTLFAIAALTILQAGTPVIAQFGFPCNSNILDNIDYPGNEMANVDSPMPLLDAETCCYFCGSLPDCNAFTWTQFTDGRCYFKKFASHPVANNPAPDGSAYMRSAVIYKCQVLKSDTDFIGSDLANSPGMSTEMCCGICRHASGCTGFSWSGFNGGTCWLKSGVLTAIPAPGVSAAQI